MSPSPSPSSRRANTSPSDRSASERSRIPQLDNPIMPPQPQDSMSSSSSSAPSSLCMPLGELTVVPTAPQALEAPEAPRAPPRIRNSRLQQRHAQYMESAIQYGIRLSMLVDTARQDRQANISFPYRTGNAGSGDYELEYASQTSIEVNSAQYSTIEEAYSRIRYYKGPREVRQDLEVLPFDCDFKDITRELEVVANELEAMDFLDKLQQSVTECLEKSNPREAMARAEKAARRSRRRIERTRRSLLCRGESDLEPDDARWDKKAKAKQRRLGALYHTR